MSRFAKIRTAAAYIHRSERSVYNYIEQGLLPVYERPGVRGAFVDLDDLDALVAQGSPGRNGSVRRFGPKAVIRQLPADAVLPVEAVR